MSRLGQIIAFPRLAHDLTNLAPQHESHDRGTAPASQEKARKSQAALSGARDPPTHIAGVTVSENGNGLRLLGPSARAKTVRSFG